MTRPAALALFVMALGSGCVPDPGPAARSEETYLDVVAAEDARPTAGPDLDLLIAATGSRSTRVRMAAVRALGRLERPELVERISRRLDDPDAGVRAEAAAALAKAVHDGDGEPALAALLSRAARERDAGVRGALAASLGALRLGPAHRRRAVRELVALSLGTGPTDDAPVNTLVGVALGFESLVREADSVGVSHAAAERLEHLLVYHADDPTSPDAGHVRALALAALSQARRMTLPLIARGLEDPDPEVRRRAVRSLDVVVPSQRDELIRFALADTVLRVRLEAIQYLSEVPRTAPVCDELIDATRDEAPAPVQVSALEALARPCPQLASQQGALARVASELEGEPDSEWQPPARALLSLAHVDRDAAARLLPSFARHASPFVRAHAAEAAGVLRDGVKLRTLAADSSANVRNAALGALFRLEGHGIDGMLIGALSDDDPQLLITVAGLLKGTSRAGVAAVLLDAFDRISAEGRETSRDPRRALLDRVADLGDASLAGRLRPYLADYDSLVAADVARLLTSWTGEAVEAGPEPLRRAFPPTVDELEALGRTTVTLHMHGGRSIVIRPLPDLALMNVSRFVRLARSGYYDGLTFHRWVPGFVIQGGSPGANEYAGDALYTRDEIGRQPHWRGAVGVSTRGRDTGDGQIFIDLVDNPRLDRDYTVLGLVVDGMDVVDRILEGAKIEHVEVRTEG